jgi:hypothetical protein
LADELLGVGVAGCGGRVVVVVVVDALVGVAGCGGRVVVVVDDVERDGLVVATVVVATRPRRGARCGFRFAEATGTEIASTTVTAVNTTTNVRSLRLILCPFFDGWEARRAPNALGTAHGRAGRSPASHPPDRETGHWARAAHGTGPERARSRQIRAYAM